MKASVVIGLSAAILFGSLPLFSESASNTKTSASKKTTVDTTKADSTKMLMLTLEELKAFNGQDGKPAYVAVDSVIYDVSKVKAWKNGKHQGNTAGNDVTKAIKTISPHGKSVLKKLPVVGKLVAAQN